LQINSINVCGLLSKLKIPEFTNFLSKSDICCINESKLDIYDVENVKVEGYTFLSNIRDKCIRKSGGIGVFVKNELIENKLVSQVKSENKNVLWFKISKDLVGVDVLCGAVYFEPENSKYANSECFELLENEISNHLNTNILIIGDFNARTGSLTDVISDDIYNPIENCDNNEVLSCVDCTIAPRVSKDCKINNYGRQLISVCKNTGLIIANGRIGSDAQNGSFTCKESSVIDYCITSTSLLPIVTDFKVEPFNECYSDVHNAISVMVKINSKSKSNESGYITPVTDKLAKPRPKWKQAYESTFKNSLDKNVNRIEEVCNIIDEFVNDNNMSQSDVNNVYDEIKNILYNSASECGSIRDHGKKNKKTCQRKNYNPWWNNECEEARKKFNKARKMPRNDNNTVLRKALSKEYKKAINKAVRLYDTEVHTKLRDLKSRNPKDYWNIINEAGQSRSNNSNWVSSPNGEVSKWRGPYTRESNSKF
jgi:hypothetical protein